MINCNAGFPRITTGCFPGFYPEESLLELEEQLQQALKHGERMKLFEFAAILHPTEDERKEGKKSHLVVDVARVVAADQSAATLLAARAIPEEHVDNLDRIEVVVRPF